MASTSARDTDFTAKLVDVFPDGTARNLTDGILRLWYRESLDKEKLANAGEVYRIMVDAGVTGTLNAPRVEGDATLAGGSFTDPLQGIRLTNIEGRATGRGNAIVLERLTAATRNGGTLRAEGRVALEPDAGFPGSLKFAAERAELISNPLMTAVASLNLSLNGPLARTARITGQVDVVSIDVSVPDRLPATVQPPPGIRRINTPPEMRAGQHFTRERRRATEYGRHRSIDRAQHRIYGLIAGMDPALRAPSTQLGARAVTSFRL